MGVYFDTDINSSKPIRISARPGFTRGSATDAGHTQLPKASVVWQFLTPWLENVNRTKTEEFYDDDGCMINQDWHQELTQEARLAWEHNDVLPVTVFESQSEFQQFTDQSGAVTVDKTYGLPESIIRISLPSVIFATRPPTCIAYDRSALLEEQYGSRASVTDISHRTENPSLIALADQIAATVKPKEDVTQEIDRQLKKACFEEALIRSRTSLLESLDSFDSRSDGQKGVLYIIEYAPEDSEGPDDSKWPDWDSVRSFRDALSGNRDSSVDCLYES